ncbi:MAG TPA: CPBP family intramembrane glutamic endopeptidase [Chitinophagales bacterium]|nr:CPBP family intramembrane glutamic endopeptidase [Chitinophagales bacterium]
MNIWVTVYAAAFLAITIGLNYAFEFEDTVLDRFIGTPRGLVYFTLFFAVAYYGMAVPVLWLGQNRGALFNRMFWVKSFLFIVILGTAIAFYHHFLLDVSSTGSERYFLRKLLANSKNFIAMLVPLALMKVWFDRRSGTGFYGINSKPFDWKTYALLVAAMLPLVTGAAMHPSFDHNYPTFKPWRINEAFGLSRLQMTALYELVYGLDFITIELIFRGALVIGMTRLLGKDAVLPMVSAYAFLHFGKPLGETLGSVFGGYILGVVALRTQSIWGGCIVHIGLAYAMELAAFVKHYAND